ncbi:MAG: MBOAT family protein, partial [Anaerolineae bacterium]|nr:MBOAT family protein [Anaerolineae bacterium]
LMGVLAFTIQIYGDFSGYSDIARGVARLMGFELTVNFRLPYFAVNPSDFWNRWHISLSTWLRDYLYIPLGGNRQGTLMTYRNLMITMLLGGLWHGAAWNFVIWGGFHGLILALYRHFEKRPVHKDPWSGEHPYGVVILKMALMFGLTMIGWLIFRARSVEQILFMLTHWVGTSLTIEFEVGTLLIIPFLIMEGIQYVSRDLLVVTRLPAVTRGIVYGGIVVAILLFSVKEGMEFIYFQF